MQIVDKHQLVLQSQEPVSSPKKGSSFVESLKPVVHDLRTHRVSSIDSVNQRLLCKSNRHFCAKIESREGFCKLYFLTYQHLDDAVSFMLLHGQNISRREFQYKLVERLEPQIIERSIVKHRVTKDKLLMKVIPHDAPSQIKEQAHREILALQKTSHWAESIGLLDYFADAEKNIYFVQKHSKMSLSDYTAS